MVTYELLKDQSDSSYMYVDCPQNTLNWEIESLAAGYAIMVSAKYLDKYTKDYNFVHYNNHEALFLTKEEENILWDLFEKAENEFKRNIIPKPLLFPALI